MPSPYAPEVGYRYDGLYWVTKIWGETQEKYGNIVFKFRLCRLSGQPPLPKRKTRVEIPKTISEKSTIKEDRVKKVHEQLKKTKKDETKLEFDPKVVEKYLAYEKVTDRKRRPNIMSGTSYKPVIEQKV